MRKLAMIVLLLIGTQVVIKAQTAEEIIKTYLENIGGEDALRAIKTIKMTGKIDAQGMTIPVKFIRGENGKMWMAYEFQGKELVGQAFDGESSWGVNQMTMKPEKSDAEDSENMKRESKDFPDAFLDYEKKGYKIELMGKETMEGAECFKVKLTKAPMLADGEEVENVEYYYFDTENYVPIVTEKEIKSGQMKGNISQTVYSDYQEAGGVYFPFSITEKVKDSPYTQPYTVENVEINVEIDDSIFAFPAIESAE